MTDSDTTATESAQPVARRPAESNILARRLATGFAVVSLVSLVMCIVLEVLLGTVQRSVAKMQADEMAIREGLELATAVREQYIHQAHMLVERGTGHMDHYPQWLDRVRTVANSLRARLPASEHWRIETVIANSTKLDELFRTRLLPAMQRADFADVVHEVHGEAERLSAEAVAHADALARMAEAGMADEHQHAIHASRLGLGAGAGGMVLVVLLAVMYTRRLRRSFLAPLASLVAAARRFGNGEFGTRVGNIGEGELQAVADACDHMVQELQARERRLIEAERMAVIGQFAAGIAHELNNPIGVIRGYLKTMRPSQPPEMLNEELQILDEEAAACQRIAEDLLAFARPSDVSRTWIHIDELLDSTVQRFTASGEAKGHHISVSVEPTQVFADGGRIRQVIMNLLNNAVQASPDGEPIEVSGTVTADTREYRFSVADRGTGVRDDEKGRIFEPFFTRRDGGSGLGLAVCHSIVMAHGGSICVEDRASRGAILEVTLPIQGSHLTRQAS